MFSIIVCDDDYETNNDIARIVRDFGEKQGYDFRVTQYYDGKELVESLPMFDVLLLDIDMPELNGIDAAKILREKSKWGQIIYVTNYADYSRFAFSVHAFHYLVKPVTEQEIEETLQESLQYLTQKSPSQTFSVELKDNTTFHIPLEEIYYFENYDRKIKLHYKDGEVVFGGKLKEVYKKLDSSVFAVPHQSFIINMLEIEHIKDYWIYMKSGESVPLSQKKTTEFKKKYHAFLENTYYLI